LIIGGLWTEAPHLHYEVKKNGEHLNPINFYYGSLSSEEYAEMLKHGLIADEAMWAELINFNLAQLDLQQLSEMLGKSVRVKECIVQEDPHEKGIRKALNLGHTFGHAIETHLGYGNWLHGEAVSVGMMMAAALSEKLGNISAADVGRLEVLLARANLPTVSPDTMQPEDYLPHMLRDKKVLAGKLRLVLLQSLGRAYVATETDQALVLDAIRACSQFD